MAKYTSQQLADWFIGKAKTAAGYRTNIVKNDERGRDNTIIGKMYFFWYDPKTKDKLPTYDKFPLVLPIERYQDGFLGLNLHYLSVVERTRLLDKLKKFANNKAFDKTTRLKVTYNLLNGTRGLSSEMRPCIKRYLFTHCRSRFVEMTADEWDKAIELPVQLFVHNKKI